MIIKNSFSQLQVLLVEPSHTQQSIIKNFLRNAGVTYITSADNGAEALRQLPQILPDVVISAMYLPDMTGENLVHAIRALPDCFTTAFILVSSEAGLEHLEPIRQAGAIALLSKPFTQHQLDIALQATIDYLRPAPLALQHYDPEYLQVLLVDDSRLFLKYLTHLLNDLRIEHITTAQDGIEALAKLQAYHYDLIITDYNMPNMNGLQLVKQIRAGDRQNNIPILMITSEQNENRLAAIKQTGVSAILDKPFEPALIGTIIADLLD